MLYFGDGFAFNTTPLAHLPATIFTLPEIYCCLFYSWPLGPHFHGPVFMPGESLSLHTLRAKALIKQKSLELQATAEAVSDRSASSSYFSMSRYDCFVVYNSSYRRTNLLPRIKRNTCSDI